MATAEVPEAIRDSGIKNGRPKNQKIKIRNTNRAEGELSEAKYEI
jgi:hypothetical protein